jgi:iron complex outermembrane receptor protein
MIQAQTLSGIVLDETSGISLPGATVIISPGEKGTASDNAGRFGFSELKPGEYSLTISFLGYESISRTIELKEGKNSRFTFLLNPIAIEAEEIVVTATKTERKLEDIPGRIELINAKQLTSFAATDMSGYLKNSSGVSVYNPGGFVSHKTNVVMRGMSGNNQARVLVLLDGMPVNKADGGSVNWNLIQSDQIEKVEISKGPGSSLYGGNALGGVINLISRSPINRLQGFLKTEYGSMNTFGGRFNLASNLAGNDNKGFYYSLNGYYRKSDGYINTALEDEEGNFLPEPDTTFTTISNTMEEYGADLKAGIRLGEDSNLELGLTYFNDRRGTGFKYYEPSGSYMDHDTKSFSLLYKGRLGAVDLRANAWYRNEDYKKVNDSDSDSKYYSVISDREDAGIQVYGSVSAGSHSLLTIGMDAKQGSVNAVDKYILVSDRVYNKGKMNTLAVFVQEEFTAMDEKLQLVAGLRFDYAKYFNGSYTIEDATSATSILQDLVDEEQDENRWNALSPRLSAQYRFNQDFRLYVTYSNGFRPSVLDDLCRSGFVRGGFKLANPDLEPERLNSYEIGLDMHVGELSVSPSLYYSKGRDFMYYVSTGDSLQMGSRKRPVRQVENIGEVEIKGMELKINYDILPSLSVYANYTYNESVVTEFNPEFSSQSEDITSKYLTYVPVHQASSGIIWRNQLVNAGLNGRFIGKHFADDLNTVIIDSYTSLDIRLWRSFGRLGIKFDIENMIGKIILVDDGYINSGRFYRIELTYNF